MNIDLLLVPYDSARRGERLGAGPEALERAGITARLERAGHTVRRRVIEPPAESWRAEIRTAFDLAATVADAVRAARADGRFPLVLSGNCGIALGVAAGLGEGVDVLWADAHADYNTPETTIGGFLDGMSLATLTGRCWTELARRVPGFSPIPDDRVWLLGARDLDPLEVEVLERSAIRRVAAGDVNAAAGSRIGKEVAGHGALYLHLDLDVLDPSAGRANVYAAPGGVQPDVLAAFCRALREHAQLAAVTLSAYDPAVDADGRVGESALRLIDALVGRTT
jgi:arginase